MARPIVAVADEAATEERCEDIREGREDPPEFDYGPLSEYGDLEAQIATERREFDERN